MWIGTEPGEALLRRLVKVLLDLEGGLKSTGLIIHSGYTFVLCGMLCLLFYNKNVKNTNSTMVLHIRQ